MRTIAVFVNPDKPRAVEMKARLEELLCAAGLRTLCFETGHRHADADADALRGAELAFVLGGDGTLLGVARQLAPLGVPLLGINAGHLGFLSEAEPANLEDTVRRVAARDYALEERMMLEASLIRRGRTEQTLIGLNDVGIAKGSFARMVTVDVYVDDVFVDSYSGDGVIVSTPTGSTAYSLSCGGPILMPQLKVMLITPICPHTLVARPCVIDSRQRVRFVVRATHRDVGMTMDGQVGVTLCPGDEVVVRESRARTVLVKLGKREFFDVLRSKLHGGNNH
ncbi:NAD(+)/NADH kinase [Alicyclobacillus macrosporangiidus]|uniref:NAD(+)/NADH kinase n=1 Tax=Alicyclobacillus macrosporangiidus TaxID=392015 RepID=UPI0026F2E2D5|nr:NAD(+)/NADH kinase [Alicyclobacillus macrosporangiidus]